jgi:hypothetical protein
MYWWKYYKNLHMLYITVGKRQLTLTDSCFRHCTYFDSLLLQALHLLWQSTAPVTTLTLTVYCSKHYTYFDSLLLQSLDCPGQVNIVDKTSAQWLAGSSPWHTGHKVADRSVSRNPLDRALYKSSLHTVYISDDRTFRSKEGKNNVRVTVLTLQRIIASLFSAIVHMINLQVPQC